MQANKLVWLGCIVLAQLTACGTDNADADVQFEESSQTQRVQEMMQSIDDTFVGQRKPGCPPAAGNVKGVGRPCTKGGGQCRGTGAPFCTVDVSSTTQYAFCTKMCFSNDSCGPSATCAANPRSPGMKGCVPNACL